MREVIYGRQPVCEVLRAGRRRVFRLLVSRRVKPSPGLEEIIGMAKSSGHELLRADDHDFARRVGEGNHQGVAVEVSAYPYVEFHAFVSFLRELADPPLVLVLDHLQDPQNLGSLLRTADAAGVHGVIVPHDRAVQVTPAVVRASSGASEHVRVSAVTNLVRTMKALKDEGLWFTGLDADPEAALHTESDLGGPLGLVVGSEGRGIGRLVKENCDFLMRLPLHGNVTSLNAGVAGAIAMYEVGRQRAKSKSG